MTSKKVNGSARRGAKRATRAPALTQRELDRVVFPVVEMFLGDWGTERIAAEVQLQYGIRLTREAVYPVVREAVRRQHLLYCPPRAKTLEDKFAMVANQGTVSVVDVEGKGTSEHVAGVGADAVVDLIKAVGRRKGSHQPVHLGLGIGQTTMRVARRLAARMRADASIPDLVVHSLSSPHSVHDPLETPLASFALFHDSWRSPGYVDLVTEPVVACKDYAKVMRRPRVAAALEAAAEIDILLTSMAAADDEHGYLFRYVAEDGARAQAALAQKGWVGDVQMRPYSRTGPIEITQGGKPVTLLELDELVAMARNPDKHVVLLCAPCGRCSRSKAAALYPLLTESSLHVWDHLIVDVGTAQEVVDLHRAHEPGTGVGAREGL